MERQLDKVEQLMTDAQYVLVLLANEQSGDFELIDPTPVPEDTARVYRERGLGFAGVLGIVDGKTRSAFDLPLEGETVTAIALAFAERVAYVLRHPRWLMPRASA
jgi:hypothetical protein